MSEGLSVHVPGMIEPCDHPEVLPSTARIGQLVVLTRLVPGSKAAVIGVRMEEADMRARAAAAQTVVVIMTLVPAIPAGSARAASSGGTGAKTRFTLNQIG